MDIEKIYRGINFRRPRRTIPRRMIAVVVNLVGFTILWQLLPHIILYWVLLLMSVVLVWMASYGWRQALVAVHDFLYRLEQL